MFHKMLRRKTTKRENKNMGRKRFFIFVLLVFLLILPSCEIVAKIFAAGVVVGIIIVIIVIALIIWAISELIDL